MLSNELSILDVGCGEHRWEYKNAIISRCDNEQAYRDRTAKLTGYVNVDANNDWPYEDGEFDTVIAADVIEHLENIWHFFREATRVASRSVIISTPNVESRMSKAMFSRTGFLWGFDRVERENSHHITPIFMWQVIKAVADVGWTIAVSEKVSMPMPPLRAERLSIAKEGLEENNERWLVVKAVPKNG